MGEQLSNVHRRDPAPFQTQADRATMTRQVSTIDWASTAVGPPDTWPRSLGTLVTVMFGSRQPMFIAWGTNRILVYNDAYVPLLGKRHPLAFGRPFFDVWPETRAPVGALMDRVFGGDPVHMDDLELTLERNGFPEQAHFTFSYTPVPGDGEAIEGLFCACTEITGTVLARRELEAERRRLGELFERSPSFMALLRGPEHRFELTNPAYKTLIGFRDVIGKTVREALPEVEGQGFLDLLDKVYSTGEPYIAQAAPLRIVQRPGADPELRYLNFVYQPMRDGSGVNGIFVEGIDVTEARADQEAVRGSAARQTLRAELGDALRGAHDEQALTMVAAETLGRYLGVERVGYGEIDEAGDGVIIDQVWAAGERPGPTTARRRHAIGRAILRELGAGRSVVVDDVSSHPLTTGESHHPAYVASVLRAFVAVPLIGPDCLVRFLFAVSPTPRAWTENERALVQEVGERTWASLDRLRAESALRDSETRNRQVLDGAVDYAIMASDLQGRVTRWNEGAHRILGWTERDMLGQTLHRIFLPDDGAAVEEERRSALKQGVAVDERWHLRRNGERFWAAGETTPIRDDAGAPIGFVKVMRDQTEQRQAEQALRESRERLDIALETGLVGFFDWDVAANLIRGDQRFAAFYDIPVDEAAEGVTPDRILDVVHPDDQRGVRNKIAAAATRSDNYARQFRLIHRDGSTHAVLESGRCYARDGQTPLRYTGVVADVTAAARAEADLRDLNETLEQRVQDRTAELLQAQEALRQSQKLEAVGQLTGGVAHDFNNLLTIIRSAVDFLRRRELPEDRRRRYVDAISDTVDRASKLTGQLLAFARRQPLKPEVFDVRQQVDNVADLVRPLVGARIKIDLDLCPTPCFTEADIGQFETALVNLAVNARDAMDGEGRLVFTVEEVASLPAIRGHRGAASRFIAISVADTGAGIDQSNLASIFEPFFTTKEVGKGTGLGLSQVFGFVKQSGGEVDVQSKPGQGSTFTLYLPRTEADPRAEAPGPAPGGIETRPHGRGICVLVVEDNEAVGQFSTELLHDLGYKTIWAGNARQALDFLDEDELRFDLVFSDVVMPGMNGIDFAELVRDRYPGLPIVLTSGYSHVLAQEGRHGFDLVQKPYSVEVLSRMLRKAISSGSSPRIRRARS